MGLWRLLKSFKVPPMMDLKKKTVKYKGTGFPHEGENCMSDSDNLSFWKIMALYRTIYKSAFKIPTAFFWRSIVMMLIQFQILFKIISQLHGHFIEPSYLSKISYFLVNTYSQEYTVFILLGFYNDLKYIHEFTEFFCKMYSNFLRSLLNICK